jgi:hypothetical protein
VVNTGSVTRLSSDIRVVNSLAPVSFSRGVQKEYYEPLWESPVSKVARLYNEANLEVAS